MIAALIAALIAAEALQCEYPHLLDDFVSACRANDHVCSSQYFARVVLLLLDSHNVSPPSLL
jgi:hypothetical protein